MPNLNVTPDQMSAAGSFISRNWGDHGYRIVNITSPLPIQGTVTVFHVRHSDGSRFLVAADKWGNCRQLPDDMGGAIDAVRAMHANAVAP